MYQEFMSFPGALRAYHFSSPSPYALFSRFKGEIFLSHHTEHIHRVHPSVSASDPGFSRYSVGEPPGNVLVGES